MIDLNLHRELRSFKRVETLSAQITVFVRTLAYSLLQNAMFKRFKSRDDIPSEYFTGKNNCRACFF